MAILNNSNAISSGGYDINNSLRFRSSASAYLNRTPASAGDRQKFTFSYWLKRGTISVDQQFYGIPSTVSTQGAHYRFNASDNLRINDYTNGVSDQIYLVTTQVFRDPSAWYHIVVAVDTTQATNTNRVKLYVNGSQITAFSTATYPSQNQNLAVNQAKATYIGYGDASSGGYFDGYMADINFIDGSQKTPSDFGETDTTTGVWKPKAYTGTYGTNGFYLKFSDIATTSGSNAGLGKDFSGNANYWTTNNISVTSGTTYDAMTDVPTNTSATVANYPTLNPLSNTSTLTEANLSASNILLAGTTMATPSTGKWYFEYTQTTSIPSGSLWVGVASNTSAVADNQLQGYAYASDGRKVAYNSYTSGYGATWTNGDVIGCALDLDNQTITFYKNNTSQGTAFTSITAQPYVFALSAGGAASTKGGSINCGQRPFAYTPPTGFVALNTYNLPDSTIVKGNTVMDATTYTGTGSSLAVVNAAGFRPDFVWGKDRAQAQSHLLFDSVRGVHNFLSSNSTSAESTNNQTLTGFNSNGFQLGTNATLNQSGISFVGWQWQAGQGSTSTNTSGSITSTVSVNTTAGFSIVTWTGNGTAGATVGHGLGVTPAFVIIKNRTATAGEQWLVWHKSISQAIHTSSLVTLNGYTGALLLNGTTGSVSYGFDAQINGSTNGMLAYCWSEISGYSRFGSYTGNGSADGVFVFTNLKPKFIMIKRTDTTSNWTIVDTAREGYNVDNDPLYPNLSNAEGTTDLVDILSNGFKLRSTDASVNANAGTYIYACFSSNPFKNSTAV